MTIHIYICTTLSLNVCVCDARMELRKQILLIWCHRWRQSHHAIQHPRLAEVATLLAGHLQ